MPRSGYYRGGGERYGNGGVSAGGPRSGLPGGTDITPDLLTSIAQIPNLPQAFLATLENLSNRSFGCVKPVDLANSDLIPQLIDILR